ncbi:MAG: hypothetical protein ABW172_03665 [Candidatus Binatia bacterium]|jgi:hypothetical protein
MHRVKIVGLAILAVALMVLGLHRWMDTYRWEKTIIAELQNQGFEVIFQTSESGTLSPWTLFYPSVIQITLVHPDSIRRFKDFIAADVISFDRDELGKVVSWPRIVLFDCTANLVANLADQQGRYEDRILRPDGMQIKQWWFEMNEAMNTYFCKKIIVAK